MELIWTGPRHISLESERMILEPRQHSSQHLLVFYTSCALCTLLLWCPQACLDGPAKQDKPSCKIRKSQCFSRVNHEISEPGSGTPRPYEFRCALTRISFVPDNGSHGLSIVVLGLRSRMIKKGILRNNNQPLYIYIYTYTHTITHTHTHTCFLFSMPYTPFKGSPSFPETHQQNFPSYC